MPVTPLNSRSDAKELDILMRICDRGSVDMPQLGSVDYVSFESYLLIQKKAYSRVANDVLRAVFLDYVNDSVRSK